MLGEASSFLALLSECSRALMECGCSSNRLERLLTQLGRAWGYTVESMALPTGVSIMISKDGMQSVSLVRIQSWGIDLDKLQRISELVDQISKHDIDIGQARTAIKGIQDSKPPYRLPLAILAGAGSSASLVNLYGGPWPEIAMAFCVGLLVTCLQKFIFVKDHRRYLADFLSAFAVALIAGLVARLNQDINVSRVITGGVVGMVPGLTLLNAIHEIAQKNLVSGSAKSVEAIVIGMSLSFGVAGAFAVLNFL